MTGLASRTGVLLLAGLIGVVIPTDVRGQGVSLDMSTGRVVYDPVSATVATNNVVGTLRYDALRALWDLWSTNPGGCDRRRVALRACVCGPCRLRRRRRILEC